MIEIKDGLILYHGSYCEVKKPDLSMCAKRKDFGQGFYLTTSREQAESFVKTSIVKAVAAGRIADDATNATLTAYISGAFETVGSREADDFCIRLLLPDKLKNQYCIKSEMAIGCLEFVEGEKIWLK